MKGAQNAVSGLCIKGGFPVMESRMFPAHVEKAAGVIREGGNSERSWAYEIEMQSKKITK
jgi:hypothetical protein